MDICLVEGIARAVVSTTVESQNTVVVVDILTAGVWLQNSGRNCSTSCVTWQQDYGINCEKPLPTLQWRHNGRDGVSNHKSHDCLLTYQRKHQNSASLAFVRGIHRWPVNSRTKGQLCGKCFHLMTSSCNWSIVHDPIDKTVRQKTDFTLYTYVKINTFIFAFWGAFYLHLRHCLCKNYVDVSLHKPTSHHILMW